MTETYSFTFEEMRKEALAHHATMEQEDGPNNGESPTKKLKAYYLNPASFTGRRVEMERQLGEAGIAAVERVEPTPYPRAADWKLRNQIIAWDHIQMWEKALRDQRDGALFFEDDVYFLKNWTDVLDTIFAHYQRNDHGCDIVKLDAAPLINIPDLPEKSVMCFLGRAFACMGGYYMSRDALVTAISVIRTHPWQWSTIEDLFKDISMNYFARSTFETCPRLCIQNWFEGGKSAMFDDEHMKSLRTAQFDGYLQKFHSLYSFNQASTDSIQRGFLEFGTAS